MSLRATSFSRWGGEGGPWEGGMNEWAKEGHLHRWKEKRRGDNQTEKVGVPSNRFRGVSTQGLN